MKPKLTSAVRRGLRDIASLASADIAADRSEDHPTFKGKRLRDAQSAIRWIDSLRVDELRDALEGE